jgi:hypothetical protein
VEYVFIAVVALLIIVLLIVIRDGERERKRILASLDGERQAWVDERRELLNRLQHPERMPTKAHATSTVRSNVSPDTRRQLAQVGTVAPQVVTDGD